MPSPYTINRKSVGQFFQNHRVCIVTSSKVASYKIFACADKPFAASFSKWRGS
jgi:hypothetical protein